MGFIFPQLSGEWSFPCLGCHNLLDCGFPVIFRVESFCFCVKFSVLLVFRTFNLQMSVPSSSRWRFDSVVAPDLGLAFSLCRVRWSDLVGLGHPACSFIIIDEESVFLISVVSHQPFIRRSLELVRVMWLRPHLSEFLVFLFLHRVTVHEWSGIRVIAAVEILATNRVVQLDHWSRRSELSWRSFISNLSLTWLLNEPFIIRNRWELWLLFWFLFDGWQISVSVR